MEKSISILDKDYLQWVQDLCQRYRQSQIKAAVKVNSELLKYYWELGKDIDEKQAENKYGSKFYATLSRDLRHEMPDVEGLSETSIRYAKRFYVLYKQQVAILPQPVEESKKANLPQLVEESEKTNLPQPVEESEKANLPQLVEESKGANLPQLVEESEKANLPQPVEDFSDITTQVAERLQNEIFSVPWGHHRYIIDKCSNDSSKALFFVHQTLKNGWSRSMLLNFIGTDLYERSGKALTNFKNTLPDVDSDLAQELTKDPYNFAFTGITRPYNERIFKDALLNNITRFLTELGTGFAYVGKEYRLQIGETENFIDLLFYNLNLSCYVVIEVKVGKFACPDVGQLGSYVVACNHILRKDGRDNPTIGLLICKEKDRIQAQYALESSSQPIGISTYDLEKFYPEKVEGTMPTIEEIEAKLNENLTI